MQKRHELSSIEGLTFNPFKAVKKKELDLFRLHEAYDKHEYCNQVMVDRPSRSVHIRQCECGACAWIDRDGVVDEQIGMAWVSAARNWGNLDTCYNSPGLAQAVLRHFSVVHADMYKLVSSETIKRWKENDKSKELKAFENSQYEYGAKEG